MGGTMPLIWGFAQRHSRAADWLDGQFGDSTHAQIARRAAAILVSRTRRSASSAMRSIVRCGAPQSRDTSAPSMIMGPVSAAHHCAQTRLWFCAASGARKRYYPFGGASDCWISLKAGSVSQAAACAASAG